MKPLTQLTRKHHPGKIKMHIHNQRILTRLKERSNELGHASTYGQTFVCTALHGHNQSPNDNFRKSGQQLLQRLAVLG